MDFNNSNNNINNNNNKDEKSYIFTTNDIPYRNDNLNYIIKPHLQDFYQKQFMAQQQQYQQQNISSNLDFNNYKPQQQPQQPQQPQQKQNQINPQSHHLINILDPFIKDKIILRKKKDGLFSSEQSLESLIPPSIIPSSRLYYLLDEINHFYSKEFFIYDRLIIFISILMVLSLFTAGLFINLNQDNNGDLSAQFLVPMSMSMVFFIFYCVSAFCRYYSCPKHMNEFCNALSSRYVNLTFKYYKGGWSRSEKIKIEYPRLHINPIVYVYVNENNTNNNKSNSSNSFKCDPNNINDINDI